MTAQTSLSRRVKLFATSSIITMPGCFSIPNRLNSFSVVKIVLSPQRSTATSIACFDEV